MNYHRETECEYALKNALAYVQTEAVTFQASH